MYSRYLGLFLSLGFFVSLMAQDLKTLERSVYSKQETLLIRNELRKRLGTKASAPRVALVAQRLRAWANLENLPPETFVDQVERFLLLEENGFSFESTEDLIPYFVETSPALDDVPYIARFWTETEKAHLPDQWRYSLLERARNLRWSGGTVWFAGRILLVSDRKEEVRKKTILLLEKNLPKQMENLLPSELSSLWNSFFPSSELENPQNKLVAKDTFRNLSAPPSSVQTSSRRMEIVWTELGNWELKERPKLDPNLLFPENLSLGEAAPLLREKIPEIGDEWLGTPYRYGGMSRSGVDCSGLTRNLLIHESIQYPERRIPRSARDQVSMGKPVSLSLAKPGDLVFFSASSKSSKITHVGMVYPKGMFIHASSTRGVVVQSLSERWWTERYVTTRDVLGELEEWPKQKKP